MKRIGILLPWSLLWLWACDPAHPCDPGYTATFGSCLKTPVDAGKGVADAAADDAGTDDAASTAVSSCKPYDHFGDKCATNGDCACGAATCATQGLLYCTRLNCMGDPKSCPPTWTCTDISAVSPDPTVTSICLKP